MFVDHKKGKMKKPIPGQCFICNGTKDLGTVFGANICVPCIVALSSGEDHEVEGRIVWD